MPSHPDRVRRNYHDINMCEIQDPVNDTQIFTVTVTRAEIATQMTTREIRNYVMNKIYKMFVIK